jgi:DNA/RNA endonuclease G (NUC1)
MPLWRLALVLALVIVLPDVARGETCANNQLTPTEVQRFDGASLLLSTEEIRKSEETHLPWGYPSRDKRLMYHKEFVFRYDVARKVPAWASYRLEKRDVPVKAQVAWKNGYCTDPRLLEEEASACSDYDNEPVFDRGHLVPDADMRRSGRAQAHSYFLPNMAPSTRPSTDSSGFTSRRGFESGHATVHRGEISKK